ncbi:MAG: gluconokinase [Bryobacteraceae bacterium]
MTSATPSSNLSANDNIVSVDVGTSSVRALLFDCRFRHHERLGLQNKYDITTTADGGVEIDPDLLLKLTANCLDELHGQMAQEGLRASAVAMSTFWHSFLGVDANGKPSTPIIHLFDTRSAPQVGQLRKRFDAAQVRQRTGCVLHTSYWPAKLLWLKQTNPMAFSRTARWISFGEYFLANLHGKGAESTSMVSASGLWKQRENAYDEELIEFIGIKEDQLAPVDTLDQPARSLKQGFASRWPLFDGIPWCPAYGDGACNNVGSGSTTRDRLALMVGTSGAMRVVIRGASIQIPSGLWCYRVNRERYILGGALSNGGEVFRWVSKTFNLPGNAESQIQKRQPGSHGLTMLPFLAGERSPYWRPDLRAVLAGMSLSTTPTDILQAALEGVSLRFKQIYSLFLEAYPAPAQVIASGGGLLASKAWRQMMADALGRSIVECLEPEASSRGAALIAAEQLGMIKSLDDVEVALGPIIAADPQNAKLYDQMLARDMNLFAQLFAEQVDPHGEA